jgi:hypothetical protein
MQENVTNPLFVGAGDARDAREPRTSVVDHDNLHVRIRREAAYLLELARALREDACDS